METDSNSSWSERDIFGLTLLPFRITVFVVIELKVCEFNPAFTGQLGVYVAAINHQKKQDADNQTIGLLICKTKDGVMAEYSLEASSQPIGISEYKLKDLLPDDYASSLPTIEEIEESLKGL